LFPDIVWSRPESKQGAGKLLIIGGNAFGFSAPATAYTEATKAGAGSIRVLLPAALEKLVGHMEGAQFAPQNPSGSFSKQALDSMLVQAAWSDAVLLAGELGRNSETAITLESFTKKYAGPLTITKDAADYFIASPLDILKRPQTTLVISIEQLQKIAMHVKYEKAVTFSMNAAVLAEWLHVFTLLYPIIVVTAHSDSLFVARNGSVISQATDADEKIWRVPTAAKASVFWMQNLNKPLEAIATSLL
jgi:hypothetical protein